MEFTFIGLPCQPQYIKSTNTSHNWFDRRDKTIKCYAEDTAKSNDNKKAKEDTYIKEDTFFKSVSAGI
jgi:hypothetical protein